jgi:hypothetical protein
MENDLYKMVKIKNESTYTLHFDYVGIENSQKKKLITTIKPHDETAVAMAKTPALLPLKLLSEITLGIINFPQDALFDNWFKECTITLQNNQLVEKFTISKKNFDSITVTQEINGFGFAIEHLKSLENYAFEQ